MNDFLKQMFGDLEKTAAPQRMPAMDSAAQAQTVSRPINPYLGKVTGKLNVPDGAPSATNQTTSTPPTIAKAKAVPKATVKDIAPNAYQSALRQHAKGSAERKALVAKRKGGASVGSFKDYKPGAAQTASTTKAKPAKVTMGQPTANGKRVPVATGGSGTRKPVATGGSETRKPVATGSERGVRPEPKPAKRMASFSSKPSESPLMKSYSEGGDFNMTSRPNRALASSLNPSKQGKGPLVSSPKFDMAADSKQRKMENSQRTRAQVATGGKSGTDAISGAGKSVPNKPMTPRTSGPGTDAYAARQRDLGKQREATRRTAELSAKKRPALVAARK